MFLAEKSSDCAERLVQSGGLEQLIDVACSANCPSLNANKDLWRHVLQVLLSVSKYEDLQLIAYHRSFWQTKFRVSLFSTHQGDPEMEILTLQTLVGVIAHIRILFLTLTNT